MVAVKVMKPVLKKEEQPKYLKKFIQEGLLMKKIRHKYIMTCMDVYEPTEQDP